MVINIFKFSENKFLEGSTVKQIANTNYNEGAKVMFIWKQKKEPLDIRSNRTLSCESRVPTAFTWVWHPMGRTGIEPVTSTLSTLHSPAELTARYKASLHWQN